MKKTKKTNNLIKPDIYPHRLRPSALKSFVGCNYKFALNYLLRMKQNDNARALLGTCIHTALEDFHNTRIKKKKVNTKKIIKKAKKVFTDNCTKNTFFQAGETKETIIKKIEKGSKILLEEVLPTMKIPFAVEDNIVIPSNHDIIKDFGGTIDILYHNEIRDLKTSSRNVVSKSHILQLSCYHYLAEKRYKRKIKSVMVDSLVFLKSEIKVASEEVETIPDLAVFYLETIKNKIDLVTKKNKRIEDVFSGNPSDMYCTKNYCPNYETCIFRTGKLSDKKFKTFGS